MDLAKLLGPAIGTLVRVAIERPVGAGLARSPVYPEGRVKLPGRRLNGLTRSLSGKLAVQVGAALSELRAIEFGSVGEDDWACVVIAACDTLGKMPTFTASSLLAVDLEPDRLYTQIRRSDPDRPEKAALSSEETIAYERVLRECCWQIVEFITRQPEFTRRVQVELVRRTGEIADSLDRLSEGSDSHDLFDFERRYLELVLDKLDNLQLFGVTLRHSDAYSLSTAYLSLNASPEQANRRNGRAGADRLRVHEALADAKRVLIRGEAGSGKTTLLQWLAVNAVQSPESLPDGWSAGVPFLLPLRRYALQDLPMPDLFLREIAPALSSEAPPKWVASVLKAGRALVLIDGVDELPQNRRGDVWVWLNDLVKTYPDSTYVITSRPPAVDGKALVPNKFDTFMLLPMGSSDVRAFVGQWHKAIRQVRDDSGHALATYESELLDKLARRRDLRRLATNPLLCALICALHLERYRQLPQDRMGLYRAALEMLLVRRDESRGINADRVNLSQQDQEALLGQLAYWLVRNGWSDCDRRDATTRLSRYMKAMPYVESRPSEVLNFLLLRSGTLREPVVGRIDFLHKTFQEYLAAQAILDDGDIDAMIKHAHEDHWREVVVMAVGHSRRDERERIIRGLVKRGEEDEDVKRRLYLLAVSCLEHPGALDPTLVLEVREKASRLVVPEEWRQVDLIAAAGEVVLDVIPDPTHLTDLEGILLIDVVNRFDVEDSLPVLARISKSQSRAVRGKLATYWPESAVESYASAVLGDMRLDDVSVRASGPGQFRAAARLGGLTTLVVQEMPGPEIVAFDRLSDLKGHSNLRTLILDRVAVIDLEDAATCPELNTLIIHDSFIRAGLQGLRGARLRELALLGIPDSAPLERHVDAIGTLPDLRRLTIDVSAIPGNGLDLPNNSALERVDFLAQHWMASAVDYAHRAPAWSCIGSGRTALDWHRPSLAKIGNLPTLKEVSISGWPSGTEIELLRKSPQLEVLRVVVAEDRLREAILSGGHEYNYPTVSSGAIRTIRALKMLKRLEIGILVPDSAGPLYSPVRHNRIRYVRAESFPTVAREIRSNLPRGSTIELSINGSTF
ncbi:NACHT domain-containing protein [Micromonospora sp. H61]|uniref:NACHT domain-containing protein n=1 Tax=unclassified Micromonospora TaxID=2617518 RepID=UPI001B37150E|nr:NACHT domain-containing protein [Micromonospora sp. H61]MBQ0992042.1 NACHT domain-containing protein [Micromonospora sp. H61]